MKIQIIILSLLFLFGSCISSSSSDAEETFKYWTGASPPPDIKLIEGQYYQSPHFTLEYELFLKFRSSDKWWTDFVTTNNLELDHENDQWEMFTELPDWFAPRRKSVVYRRKDAFERSRYFFDPYERICYIYETVGM